MVHGWDEIILASGGQPLAGVASTVAALVESGLTYEEHARELVTPNHAGRIGCAPFQQQNNNANIHRITARIKELQRAVERTEPG